MNYEDFVELCQEAQDECKYSGFAGQYWEPGEKFDSYSYAKIQKKDVFWFTYVSGGSDGGNCWEGVSTRFDKSRPNIEFANVLIKVLETYKPDISLIQYKLLESAFKDRIEYSTDSEFEYYGNFTDYNIEYISFEAVYAILKDHDL